MTDVTSEKIQALLDVLYESYKEKKTFHPVDTATLLAEMFSAQRGLMKKPMIVLRLQMTRDTI
jgi:hypothetical protein